MSMTDMPVGVNPVKKSRKNYSQEQVISDIKTDFNLALFYLSARIMKGKTWMEFAESLSISEDKAEEYAEKLISTGLWIHNENGVSVANDFMSLGDLKISEFLSMTLNITSRMTETGPAWYDSLLVATTDKIRKEFYKDVNRAFNDLIEKSAKVEPDMILAWSHSSLYDCLTSIKEPSN